MATQAKRVFDCCPATAVADDDGGGFCCSRHTFHGIQEYSPPATCPVYCGTGKLMQIILFFISCGAAWLEGAAGAADEMSWALARRHVTSMSSVINRVIITDPITY